MLHPKLDSSRRWIYRPFFTSLYTKGKRPSFLFVNLSILIEEFVPDREVIWATLVDITVFPQVYYMRGKISILGEIP
jgi:hypothetical protein